MDLQHLPLLMSRRTKRISTLGSRATSLVSVFLVLLLLGIGMFVGVAGSFLHRKMQQNVGFVVVMERECPGRTIDDLKSRLHLDPAVDHYTYTSAESILKEEAAGLGEDILSIMESNPYSGEFKVRVGAPWANADSIDVLVKRYSDVAGVGEIISENEMLERVDALLRRVAAVLAVMALILLIVSIVLINNTLSLSIYGRRFSIHTMKLVGATPGFIRRPFVLASLRDGLLAGLLAGGVLLAARWYAADVDAVVERLLPRTESCLVASGMVLLGALICTITAFFASRRYLRASYDEMFMK